MADPNKSYYRNKPAESTELIFSHPAVDAKLGKLVVPIKPDQITWSYNLVTASYPTYGGEVVQILAMNVGDMTVAGTLRSYKQMESVYKWFYMYMQFATQGRGDSSISYDMRPVEMTYLERGWKFDIMPYQLPGFKYGRDVVAPVWRVQAAVVEASEDFKNVALSDSQFNGIAAEGDFDPFGSVTAGIGYDDQNPWSQPYDATDAIWDSKKKKLVDDYQGMLAAWQNNKDDITHELSPDWSKPKFLKG